MELYNPLGAGHVQAVGKSTSGRIVWEVVAEREHVERYMRRHGYVFGTQKLTTSRLVNGWVYPKGR